jgi:hypothetical protein
MADGFLLGGDCMDAAQWAMGGLRPGISQKCCAAKSLFHSLLISFSLTRPLAA